MHGRDGGPQHLSVFIVAHYAQTASAALTGFTMHLTRNRVR